MSVERTILRCVLYFVLLISGMVILPALFGSYHSEDPMSHLRGHIETSTAVVCFVLAVVGLACTSHRSVANPSSYPPRAASESRDRPAVRVADRGSA
jgi:hypothetical protein